MPLGNIENRLVLIIACLLLVPGLTVWDAPPSALIFIADDQGMGDLGCYGYPTLKTPHVDRLAREGMLFDSAFLTISSCSPTRCLDNWRVESSDRMPTQPRRDGWIRNGRPLPHNQPWYDNYIKARGKSNEESPCLDIN
jgi:arylsulfatase